MTHAVPSSGNADFNANPIIDDENIGCQSQILSEYSFFFSFGRFIDDADARALVDDENSAMLAVGDFFRT